MSRSTHAARWLSLIGLMAVALVVLPRGLRASEDTVCHPALDPDQAQYVIGYGSLMETASKEHSWPHAGNSAPIMVRGYERSWNARGTDIGFSTTFLGIEPKQGAEMVAALYSVLDTVDFAAGDAREFIYCRVLVDRSQVTRLDGSDVPTEAQFWIYMLESEHRHPPDARFPIVQSYVDLFLSGCIELASMVVAQDFDFLAGCITTTKGWSTHWVNDRIYPRRAIFQPNAARIDTILHQMLPEQFQAIRIE